VKPEDVPESVMAAERKIRIETAKESGKPEKMLEKIVDGQMTKWLKELCLLDQPFVKDDKKTIFDLQQDLVATLGENISVRRFVRFELGEGLQKKEDNFAAEVAAEVAKMQN
jgi:elongation factor Ts